MKAIVIKEHGGPEVLQLSESPTPVAAKGEVRVRVHAVGVNRADVVQRMGNYPAPKGCVQNVPGLEFAGEIESVGLDVDEWKLGDRVFGLVPGGAYAEFVVVHSRCISAIPESTTYEEAAALAEALITAYDAMVVQGRLASGEFVLINACASGVGTAAIQIAKAIGAVPIGITRSAHKADKLRELGLAHVIINKDGNFAAEVRSITNDKGVDVVLELAGGDHLKQDLDAAALRARIIIVGLLAGRATELDMGKVMMKRLEIKGTTLRARPLEERILATQILSKNLRPLICSGAIKAIIDKKFALSQASDAHAYMEKNANIGKIVLTN